MSRLKRFARSMRREPSVAERMLWKALRDRRLARLNFRRQVPMGRYIADFVCYFPRLIIEVDGGQHNGNAGDTVRDRWFEDLGFKVLRYWNPHVIENLEGVLTDIARQVDGSRSPSFGARKLRPQPTDHNP